MPIPGFDLAIIDEKKLTEYLLSELHPIGKSKANVFITHGYYPGFDPRLVNDLYEVVRTREPVKTIYSAYGTKYIVDGILKTPCGALLQVRTVWLLNLEEYAPRLITAYPR